MRKWGASAVEINKLEATEQGVRKHKTFQGKQEGKVEYEEKSKNVNSTDMLPTK